ncbi:MAG: hypothetical protein P4K83_11455 [Terracidiphilus sp.]|nr:hypothetical protein [Terracidiphilus sp.]
MLLGRLKKLINKLLGPVSWWRDALKFYRFLARCREMSSFPGVGEGNRVGVLVMPWMLTRAPWFATSLGLLLAMKGARVTFVVDDMMFGNSARDFKLALKSINKALRLLENDYKILRLSDYRTSGPRAKISFPEDRIAELANLNTVWFMRGESQNSGRGAYQELVAAQLRKTVIRISMLLRANQDFSYLLMPGGIYGASCIWYELAKEQGVRAVTYDSGLNCLLVCTDGIAAQLQDLPRAFECLRAHPELIDSVVAEAQFELDKRWKGKDEFGYQKANSEKCDIGVDNAVLIPLNSPWDSAALGLHAVFDGSIQWVVETVRWILDNTQQSVIVRQHPGECSPLGRSTDDYGEILRNSFGDSPRIRFVAANDPINTYELLERAKLVVVHTSTIGVEAACMAKSVITAAKSYYSDLGFVFSATSRNDYFELLRRGIAGELLIDGAQVQAAWSYYYLAQCCNWVFTNFNPCAFSKWVDTEIPTLYRDTAILDVLTAIDANIPLSLIRHRRRQLERSKVAGC